MTRNGCFCSSTFSLEVQLTFIATKRQRFTISAESTRRRRRVLFQAPSLGSSFEPSEPDSCSKNRHGCPPRKSFWKQRFSSEFIGPKSRMNIYRARTRNLTLAANFAEDKLSEPREKVCSINVRLRFHGRKLLLKGFEKRIGCKHAESN